MDFENFMKKKLGGKYRGPAPPSSPSRNTGSAPAPPTSPISACSFDLTSGFSPLTALQTQVVDQTLEKHGQTVE